MTVRWPAPGNPPRPRRVRRARIARHALWVRWGDRVEVAGQWGVVVVLGLALILLLIAAGMAAGNGVLT